MVDDLFKSSDTLRYLSGLDRIYDSHQFTLPFFKRGDYPIPCALKWVVIHSSSHCSVGCKEPNTFGVLKAAPYPIQSAFNNTHKR